MEYEHKDARTAALITKLVREENQINLILLEIFSSANRGECHINLNYEISEKQEEALNELDYIVYRREEPITTRIDWSHLIK